MEFLIIQIKTLLVYFKPCSPIVRSQNTFKWDQIKSGTEWQIALTFISKVYLSNSWINPLGLCQMDLLIRHWNKEKMQLEVRLWDSLFMGHCTSHDLKNHFNERTSDFNLNKILKILKILNKVFVDDPSVNLKFYQNVPKAIVKSLKYPDLLTLTAVPYKNSWCIQNGSWTNWLEN